MAEPQSISLKDLHLGKIDGRFELDTSDAEFIDQIFYKPEQISSAIFDSKKVYFVYGNRGVGKTSIIRWLHSKRIRDGRNSSLILFKSDITDSERADISRSVGFSFDKISPEKMQIAQDFKQAWIWFILHRIGKQIADEPALVTDKSQRTKLLDALGLGENSKIEKLLGWLPKIRDQRITISGSVGLLKAEFEGNFSGNDNNINIPLHEANRIILELVCSVNLQKHIDIFIDELEIFYNNSEQYDRDRRLIRDLIFAVSEINEKMISASRPISIVCAVRSEVLDSLRSVGEEVQRRVHDRGVEIDWRSYNCDLKHPIIQMIRNKLAYSEKKYFIKDIQYLSTVGDIIFRYFPERVGGIRLENFLLDKSFYRPRDLVIRLNIAKNRNPDSTSFTESILKSTEAEYSNQLWDEVEYGLRASYDEEGIRFIIKAFSGKEAYFELREFENRLTAHAPNNMGAKKILKEKGPVAILEDLYRMGVVGNSYISGHGKYTNRNRWIFRGDREIFTDKRMVLHQALWRRFDAVDSTKQRTKRRRKNKVAKTDTSGT